MNIHYLPTYYLTDSLSRKEAMLKEIKKEPEYKALRSRLKEWDKKQINNLQSSFLEASNYFNALPYQHLTIQDFLELFDINKSFISFRIADDYTRLILGPDADGKCLQVNFISTYPYTSIVCATDIPGC